MLGAVLTGFLLSLYAALDGRSLTAGALGFVIALPVCVLAITMVSESQRTERRGLLVLAFALGIAGVIIIPLGIGGNYPRHPHRPSPSFAEPMAWILGALSAAALLVVVFAKLIRTRRAPTGDRSHDDLPA